MPDAVEQTEASDIESSDIESSDIESSDIESSDIESSDTKASQVESSQIEPSHANVEGILVDVRAVLFDVNGTLVHILTDEDRADIFRSIGHFLTYQGIEMRRSDVRELYFATLKRQRRARHEQHPEFDAVAVWCEILDSQATDYTRALPPEKREQLPLFLAELYRGISRSKLKLYPNVRRVLGALRERFPLAVVTDAQSAWARAELNQVGLLGYFDAIVVSGDYGYRKPDRRLFEHALARIGVAPKDAVYVGNDMHRDIYGAQEAGMRTVMFDSDQGVKQFDGRAPDFRIADYRELLPLLGLPDLPD